MHFKLIRLWEEAVTCYLKVICWNLCNWTEKYMKIQSGAGLTVGSFPLARQ